MVNSFNWQWPEGAIVVRRFFHKGKMIYLCEYCGFGYKDIAESENCEAYCGTHDSCSCKITRAAVYTPHVMIIPHAN